MLGGTPRLDGFEQAAQKFVLRCGVIASQSNTWPRFQGAAMFASGTSSNCATNVMVP